MAQGYINLEGIKWWVASCDFSTNKLAHLGSYWWSNRDCNSLLVSIEGLSVCLFFKWAPVKLKQDFNVFSLDKWNQKPLNGTHQRYNVEWPFLAMPSISKLRIRARQGENLLEFAIKRSIWCQSRSLRRIFARCCSIQSKSFFTLKVFFSRYLEGVRVILTHVAFLARIWQANIAEQ